MKTFIALTFIGILTYAYAAAGIDKCKEVTAMDGFSATNFFTGKWYVTHVQKKTSNTVCQTFSTSKSSDGKYVVEYTYENKNGQNQVRCEAKSGEGQKLTFSCQNGDTTFEAVFVIMDTDYNDYALFYRCVTFTSGYKNDNYLVLSRKAENKAIPGSLTSSTSKLGLKSCEDIKTLVL